MDIRQLSTQQLRTLYAVSRQCNHPRMAFYRPQYEPLIKAILIERGAIDPATQPTDITNNQEKIA